MKTQVKLTVWNEATKSYEDKGKRDIADGTNIKKGTHVKDTGTSLMVAQCGGGRPVTKVTSTLVQLG